MYGYGRWTKLAALVLISEALVGSWCSDRNLASRFTKRLVLDPFLSLWHLQEGVEARLFVEEVVQKTLSNVVVSSSL